MKKQQAINKLLNLVKDDIPQLEKNSIIPQDSGYLAFGKYHISPPVDGIVTVHKQTQLCGEFNNVKTALSWCIADKFRQFKLADQILQLEKQIIMVVADLHVRSTLASRFKTPGQRSATEPKLSARRYRLTQLNHHLDKCVNLAKYWQIRGFNNETARTGRQASYRTNR